MTTHDGVSKLWILRIGGGLDVAGYAGEAEAIGALVRHALVFGPSDARAKLEAAFAEALRHLDEQPAPDSDGFADEDSDS